MRRNRAWMVMVTWSVPGGYSGDVRIEAVRARTKGEAERMGRDTVAAALEAEKGFAVVATADALPC